MGWRAWADKKTGELVRIFMDGEPTPEFSEKTHTLLDLADDQIAPAKAGYLWDTQAKQLVAPAPEPVKTAQQQAADDTKAKLDAADAYLKRLPSGVLELIAQRVAQILKSKP